MTPPSAEPAATARIHLLLPGQRAFGRILDGLPRQGYGVERRFPCRSRFLFADTGDGRLFKRGHRLTLTRRGASAKWVFTGPDTAPSERIATLAPSPSGEGWPVVHLPAGAMAEAVAAVAGPRALLALLEGTAVEATTLLSTPSGGRIEARALRFRVHPSRGGGWAGGTLIGLDLLEGEPESLVHLEDYLVHHRGLLPTSWDLLPAGLRLLGVRPPGAPAPDALEVQAGDPFPVAARKTVARLALRLEENREGTEGGWDDEFLHDMRVAVRRMRSALRLFGPNLGEARADRLRAELKWLGDALGAVRDLDVFLSGLMAVAPASQAAPGALRLLEGRILALRSHHRADLVRALRGAKYRGILSRIEAVTRPRATARAAAPSVAAGAPPLVARAVARALKAASALGEDPPPEDLHRLRILFKRARYACEFFRETLGGPAEAIIPRAIAFQDLLGAHQDAAVAAERVRWAAEEIHGAGELDLPGVLGLGTLIQAYREEGRSQRLAFLKLWKAEGKQLRALRDELRAL